MPALHRRSFLAGLGAAVLAPGGARPGQRSVRAGDAVRAVFAHGVASFDPTVDAVLLWTRVEPTALAGGGEAVRLTWEVLDPDGTRVNGGDLDAVAATGWTATVDATGLAPGTSYRFRFTEPSTGATAEGRTRTLPDSADRLRLGVVSCSRYAAGGFAAYRALADREVDLVVHLGDYIYEDGAAGAREHDPPARLTSLEQYRRRYAQHRADPHLQALHARHPVVAIWDDHELAGNAWRDGSPAHDDRRDGPFTDRIDAAVQAHHEWVPLRLPDPGTPRRTWRSLRAGDHVELMCLDTRLWGRDRQPADAGELWDPQRTLLGADQRQWLVERLDGRGPGARGRPARWRVLANQVMFHPLAVAVPVATLAEQAEAAGMLVTDGTARNADQWDGYPAERERVVDAIGGDGGVVVLSGDLHSSWGWEGPASGPEGPSMVELVAPAVSSDPFGERLPVDERLVRAAIGPAAEALAHVELRRHGYLLLELGADELRAEWSYVDRDDPASERFGAGVAASRAAPMHLRDVPDPMPEPEPGPAPEVVPGRPRAEASAPEPDGGSDGRSGGGDLPLVPAAGAAAAAAALAATAAVAARRHRATGSGDPTGS